MINKSPYNSGLGVHEHCDVSSCFFSYLTIMFQKIGLL